MGNTNQPTQLKRASSKLRIRTQKTLSHMKLPAILSPTLTGSGETDWPSFDIEFDDKFTSLPTLQLADYSSATTENDEKIQTITDHHINNGLTGKYISTSIAETAYMFWIRNIANIKEIDKLEIGCAIFFTAMQSSDASMKRVLRKLLNGKKIEIFCLQLLDYFDTFTQQLLCTNIDLIAILVHSGKYIRSIGLDISHFPAILTAIHETFQYYFDTKYSINEKYAIDKICCVAAQIMTGQDIQNISELCDFQESFNDLGFLKSLEHCLNETICGKQYLFQYLKQSYCDEIPMFLDNLSKFKSNNNDTQRFIIAKDIVKTSIAPSSLYCINVSFETRSHVLTEMHKLERMFEVKNRLQTVRVSKTMFDACEREILQLIRQNIWKRFVKDIEKLYNSSNDIYH